MQMCAITIEEKTSGKTNEVEAKGKFLLMESTLEVQKVLALIISICIMDVSGIENT